MPSTNKLLTMNVPAIMLAAGASRRLGRPKQLLELAGETLVARTIRIAREAGADPLLVVLGAHAEIIGASVVLDDVVTVFNSQWEEGMASSIRAGLRVLASCAPDADGVLILGCDQPRLSSSLLRTLRTSFEGGAASTIAASVYAENRGVPAVFPRSLVPTTPSPRGRQGRARSLVRSCECSDRSAVPRWRDRSRSARRSWPPRLTAKAQRNTPPVSA